MNLSSIVIACCSMAWLSLPATQAQSQEDNGSKQIENWIRESAVPFDDSAIDFGSMDGVFRRARVIALGEATHGQHEVFEIKRQLTMHLVRTQGVRLVAYEASASKMLEANGYVSGESDVVAQAMGGFGMLIWQIEENRALLDDLREWNRQASEQDQVRLVGIDAQDGEAAMSRLIQLIGDDQAEAVSRIRELAPRAQKSIAEMMAGSRASWDGIAREIEDLRALLQGQIPADSAKADEYGLRVEEFLYSLSIFSSRGGRDQAMAELLLRQLEQAGTGARCVVWAHNAHIQRSPLGYLRSPELAMGGHLARRLGDGYYALGVAFGEGGFQANAPAPDGSWGFRRYRLSPAPAGSLDWMLGKVGQDRYLLDLRDAPQTTAVQQWLHSPHGQRWFGGYSVPEDCDSITSDASRLMPTTPREDFDGLLYVARTTSAKPLDSKLILEDR